LAVSQISLPFRIALVAMLAACAVWFTVLRPKPPAADAPLPAAPGTTGLAHDVAAAKGAAAASAAAKPATTAAAKAGTKTTPKAATKSSKAAPAKAAPAAKPAPAKAKTDIDPSAPLLRALDRDHAVVLLFWNRHGSDDRAVRHAAQRVDRRHGRVDVKVVPVASVGRYTAITKGVQILEAPTVLVIAPGGKARAIAGLTSTPELNQTVADVLAGVKSGK
jgi:pyruvate/2-oxoglutarate dehydrogenase complex dihydrolipoamide acyltransferase (E2) component